MDQLFAPWRIEWVRRQTPDEDIDCVFCHFWETDADRDKLVVARAEHSYALLNNYPYNPGHMMIVPVDHTGHLPDLEQATVAEVGWLTQRAIETLEASYEPDGFNVGYNLGGSASGGSIDNHVHQHVVPRWSGDTNFMPIIDETKVIVEALEATYDQLHGAFAELPEANSTATDRAVELRQS